MIELYLFIAFGAALILVYVPATFELKKPSDNGPRIIETPHEPKNTSDYANERINKLELNPQTKLYSDVLADLSDFEI
jgi:hypothetical protein